MRLAAAVALALLPALASADGVLWGRENGILVFYPLTACSAVPTGTRGLCFDSPSGEIKVITDTGSLVTIEGSGGAGGAPDSARYWVGAADATLTSEMNLGALTTGLVLNTVAAGIGTPSAYAGTTPCAAQFIRSINASGVATCESIVGADLPNPGAATRGGVEAETCGGTDKVSAITTGGLVVCTADVGGGSGLTHQEVLTRQTVGF